MVDRLEKLRSTRKEIEAEKEKTKESLVAYSEKEGVDRIFGSTKVA